MTLGEIAVFNLGLFSERLGVGIRASLLRGGLGRDESIQSRGILTKLWAKSLTAAARLNMQAVSLVRGHVCWDSFLTPQGQGLLRKSMMGASLEPHRA